MDITEHYRVDLVIHMYKVAIFTQFSALWRTIWPKRTQKCVYGDEMFFVDKIIETSVTH